MNVKLSLLFFITCITIGFTQQWTTELDSVLKIIEQDNLYDGQILIAKDGKILFHKAYGQLEDGSDITTSTSLAVKSITKGFTSLAVLKLMEEGRLDLDHQVSDYLSYWPYKGITIKHLLSMSSGLPDFVSQAVHYGDTTQYMYNTDILRLVSKHKVDARRPGYFYSYKNSNYITLAALIEEVSGIPYEAYVNKHIIDPLGLEHTYLQDLSKGDDAINADTFYAPSGDGNLYSTAEDLYAFEQSFYTDNIISKATIDKIFKQTSLANDSISNYGLGWWVLKENQREYYILGDGPNIRASIQRFPDTKSTLIYVHNVTGRHWREVYWVIRNIYNGDSYDMPKKDSITDYAIDKSLYNNYAGQYVSKGFGLLHVTTEDGKLFIRPNPIPGKEELLPSSDTTFYFADKSVEWEFFLNDDGSVKGIGFKGKPETIALKQD